MVLEKRSTNTKSCDMNKCTHINHGIQPGQNLKDQIESEPSLYVSPFIDKAVVLNLTTGGKHNFKNKALTWQTEKK